MLFQWPIGVDLFLLVGLEQTIYSVPRLHLLSDVGELVLVLLRAEAEMLRHFLPLVQPDEHVTLEVVIFLDLHDQDLILLQRFCFDDDHFFQSLLDLFRSLNVFIGAYLHLLELVPTLDLTLIQL